MAITLVSACSATSAGPAPFSASPAPSVTGSVVAPIPASAGPVTTAPVPSATAVSPTKVTPTTPANAATTAPAAGALRTSYPGIKNLVIVRSRWNNTPAGRAALNAVAAYTSYLTLVPALKTTKPLEGLFLPSCLSCLDDIRNDADIIRKHYSFRSPTGDIRPTTLALDIEWRRGSTYSVRADEQDPAGEIVDEHGAVVVRSPARLVSTESLIETKDGSGKIVSYFAAAD